MRNRAQNSFGGEFGGVIVEFAIVIAFIMILLQSAITLCEKIALRNWLDNTTYQLVYSASQQPNNSKQSSITSKTQQLFGIFNGTTREFWRLGAFKASDNFTTSDPNCQANSQTNYPSVCWQFSPEKGLITANLQGSMSSIWSGYASSRVSYISHYRSNSQGFYPDIASGPAFPQSPQPFTCNASGNCTGGFCGVAGCLF